MTVSTDLDRRFREAAAPCRAPRRGLRHRSTARSDRCWPPPRTAGSPASRSTPIPSRSSSRSPGSQGCGCSVPRVRSTRRAASSTTTSRSGATRSTCRSTSVAYPVQLQVLEELANVPYGQTATYGELAERAGNPRAARAIGMMMNHNRSRSCFPATGSSARTASLVGYGGGLDRKEQLLRLEGAML